MTRPRRPALVAALVLICMPVALASVDAVAFYVSNRATHSMVSSGLRREYTMHVPPSHDASRPVPLVISLHGAGMWPAAQQDTSQWNRVADREGFIVVYPSGLAGRGPRIWESMPGAGLPRDVAFIADLIDELSRTVKIDPARIYANGLSNGGGMSFVLSCTMSDRIAAVGLVGSAQTLPWAWCRDQRPVPMIAFHGTADDAVPYTGGSSWVSLGRRIFPDIEEWAAHWARRNRCGPTPAESPVAADVTRIAYPDCDAAPVVLYRIEGGGHSWPGGGHIPEWFVGTTTRNIDASSVMWEFFKAHPLRK